MDSGNSGSMQSSSGGDDDSYDSRAAPESISVFFNNHLGVGVGPMSNPPPPPPPQQPPSNHRHHQNFHHQSSMFDPLSNYFDPISSSRSPQHFTNPNPLLNLDLLNWSKTIRSDHNTNSAADLGAFIASSSSPSQPQTRPNFASLQIPQAAASGPGSGSNDQSTRNPKKRSRASRRAPTTVLTTDTTNFRAMVQEFTGIPAPPFTSSPFPRSRLDIFGTSSNTFRTPLSHLDSPPSYLLRPFAHKIQPSTSSSIADAVISTTTTTNVNSGNSDLGLVNLNPILNFHPLFQPSPKFPFSSFKPQQNSLEIPGNDSHLKMGVFEDFGLGPVNTNLPGLQHIDHTRSENNWGEGDDDDDRDHDHALLRSITTTTNNNNNGKVNYSGSASDFHGDKGSENVAARTSQGMMESWICSSD